MISKTTNINLLKEFLNESANKTNETLAKSLNEWKTEVNLTAPEVEKVNNVFLESVYGGKVLRGTLVKLGYLLTGKKFNRGIYKISAAYEIIHSALLCHDDIIDLSPTRRGKPSVYYKLGGNHYGISQSICLGDLGFYLSSNQILNSNFPDNLKNKALTTFNDIILKTILGQMLDIELPECKGYSSKGILAIQRLKTAEYTITGPLSLGAILGNGNKELLNTIKEFGVNLGIAYQIRDDILGTFGEEAVIGKSVTSDIEEGKCTLLIYQAYKSADTKQRQILDKFYGKRSIKYSDYLTIRKIFEDTGALKYSQKKLLEYTKKAEILVPKLAKDDYLQSLLYGLLEYLVSREK